MKNLKEFKELEGIISDDALNELEGVFVADDEHTFCIIWRGEVVDEGIPLHVSLTEKLTVSINHVADVETWNLRELLDAIKRPVISLEEKKMAYLNDAPEETEEIGGSQWEQWGFE